MTGTKWLWYEISIIHNYVQNSNILIEKNFFCMSDGIDFFTWLIVFAPDDIKFLV